MKSILFALFLQILLLQTVHAASNTSFENESTDANERNPFVTTTQDTRSNGSKTRRLRELKCILLIKITHYETHETTTLDCQPIATLDGENISSKPLTLENIPDWLSEKLEKDEIHSNSDILEMSEAIVSEEGNINIPIGAQASFISEDNESRRKRRHLSVTGNKSVLAMLIKGNNLNTPSYNRKTLSNKIFGTDGDVYNLKTGYSACSYDKLQFSPTTGTNIFNGVMTVDLGNVNNDSADIFAAALSANGWDFLLQPPHDYVSALVSLLYIFFELGNRDC